ncbi:MAG: class I SAM-dependent methyltransferase, partial [Candidatus Woesearchaeota archaeon]
SRGLTTLVMDFEELKLPIDYYDAVWAMTSLIHIPKKNWENTLYKVKDVLKDNGLLFIGVHEGSEDGLKAEKDFPANRYFSKFNEEEFEQVVGKVFDIEEYWKTTGAFGVQFLNCLAKKR